MMRVFTVGCGVIVALPLLVVVVVVAWFSLAAGAASGPGGGSQITAPIAAIPSQFIPLYNEAGRAFGVNPWLLAAIHKHETGFSTNPDTFRINFAGCCIGPMQMNVRDGTWDAVKDAYLKGVRPRAYPHRVTPHPQPTDSFDAVIAAAKLLRLKAGGRTLEELDDTARDAARAYAGAGPEAERYAEEVMAIARAFAAAAHAPSTTDGGLAWPVPRSTPITSPFCERRAWEPCHPGIDLGVASGTPIRAAAGGRVTIAGQVSGYGNYVCIQHEVHLATCYAHLSRFANVIHVGAVVERGELIAFSGCTGLCFGPHLHFEVRLGAGLPAPVVDPLGYLPR